MTTAIPAANLKVFPSADDINSGSVGSGNIVTEENMIALLKTIPPMNFIIDGFELSIVGDHAVEITQGEAFIGGYYVQTDATITYTIDPIPTTFKDLYFYLFVSVTGTVTGAGIYNSTQDIDTVPTSEANLSGAGLATFIGYARTDEDGHLEYIEQTKRNYGGGISSGTYVGTGDGDPAVALQSLDIVLGFSPSFVYVAGETGVGGSGVVAASGLLPAGVRTLASIPAGGVWFQARRSTRTPSFTRHRLWRGLPE